MVNCTHPQRSRYLHGGSSAHGKTAALDQVGGCEFGPPTETQPCAVFEGSTLLPNASDHGKFSKVQFSAFGLRDKGSQSSLGHNSRPQFDSDPEMEILASFTDGIPALTRQSIGQGNLLHYSWLPGISYAYQRAIGTEAALGAVLRNVSALAGVCAPVIVSERRVEAPLMLHPDGNAAVVTLLNWRCTENTCAAKDSAVKNLSVKVRLPFVAAQIHSVTHGDLATAPCDESHSGGGDACDSKHGTHVVCFLVDLGFGDFVTIHS